MKNYLYWLTPIVVLILIVATFYGVHLYKKLTLSVQVEVQDGPSREISKSDSEVNASTKKHLTELLLDAGLNKTPILDASGISGHIERFLQGDTNLNELQQYAKDLKYLNKFTADKGTLIPTSFWDVRTQQMQEKNWTEYSIVHQLTQPKWESYLRLLSRGYARFLKFKSDKTESSTTALDTALDMFTYVEDYYQSTPFSTLTEHAKEIKGETEAVLMIWQSLVAGSTRTNPLTGKPMFSHSIFSRDNVGIMYQYHLGKKMTISKVWGVSGFAPRFIGISENNNQIEHMSISMILQIVMKEPVLVLDGIEEEKILLGHANSAEGHADMALNNAIHREFVPYFHKNSLDAVERLRLILKKP